MIRLSGILAAMLFSIPSVYGQAAVRLVSPVPQSRYHSPETAIVLHLGQKTSFGEAQRMCQNINLEGGQSGSHRFELVLSDDGQTVNLKPLAAFSPSEKAWVRFAGTPLGLDDFWFQVSANAADLDKDAGGPQGGGICPDEDGLLPGFGNNGDPSGKTDGLEAVFPNINISVNAGADTGYLFFSTRAHDAGTYYIILDGGGNLFRYTYSTAFGGDFKVQQNGQITHFDGSAPQHYILDEQLNITDSLTMVGGYLPDGHELVIKPDGTALMMCYDRQTVDMSVLVPGGNPQAQVTGVVLQEIDPSGMLLFQWRSWDHYQITDGVRMDFTQPAVQYVHANSLQYDTDGNIIMSARHMDEVTKIDRTTGEIIWRLGGQNNMFTFVGDPLDGFRGQHHARRIANGKLTLFDNGFFHAPPVARAVEYELDETNLTATLVWEYRSSPPIYSRAMGSVQRLPNGNTLIGWGLTLDHVPMATEVDPLGFKTFEFILDIPDASYRVLRFPLGDFSTGLGNGRPPDGLGGLFNLEVWPNTVQAGQTVAIKYNGASAAGELQMQLLDASGRVLERLLAPTACYNSSCTLHWAVPDLPPGAYFVRLVHDSGRHEAQRLLLR